MTPSTRVSAGMLALVVFTVLAAGALAAGAAAAQEMTDEGMSDGDDAMTTETMGNETTTAESMTDEGMGDESMTEEGMDGEPMTQEGMDDGATESGGQPGFGVAVALVALLAAAGVVRYRRHR